MIRDLMVLLSLFAHPTPNLGQKATLREQPWPKGHATRTTSQPWPKGHATRTTFNLITFNLKHPNLPFYH
ncbi:MAG: hypothetical protein F6K26_11240 [Moorea sp. SIO2I5]|nr:hypothetical protein [Moorena sp. SIO2I5]